MRQPAPSDEPSRMESLHRSHAHAFDRIVLTGFMGAGKSTIGALLGEALDYPFVDLDQEIEASAQTTVSGIFSQSGETHFRKLETQALQRLLTSWQTSRVVLALGGGALESPANVELLTTAPRTIVVYLEAPLEILLQRCRSQSGDQPGHSIRPNLLMDEERLRELFRDREPRYRAAHITIATGDRDERQTVTEILARLHSPSEK